MSIKPNTKLNCGCCGKDFRTWKGYTDEGQDKGHGICRKCQDWGLQLEYERRVNLELEKQYESSKE